MPKQSFRSPVAAVVIGENIADARSRAGLKTQKAGAAEAGVEQPRLSDWESGKVVPGADNLLRLAAAFKCRVDDFLGGVDARYDELIERGIPVHVRRHYEAQVSAARHELKQAIEQTRIGVETLSPMPAAPAEDPGTTGGKSKPARAGRARKTKTPKQGR